MCIAMSSVLFQSLRPWEVHMCAVRSRGVSFKTLSAGSALIFSA